MRQRVRKGVISRSRAVIECQTEPEFLCNANGRKNVIGTVHMRLQQNRDNQKNNQNQQTQQNRDNQKNNQNREYNQNQQNR